MSTYRPGSLGIDLKRIWRQFIGKLWIVILVTAAGALIGFAAYEIYINVMNGNNVYTVRNDYYIYLNYEDFPEGPDYFNAYTWDGILRDDPVVDRVLEADPSLTKEQILTSVKGEILGDYRLLTVVVTGPDQDLIRRISDAYEQGLPMFADKIDSIEKIELWTDADMQIYDAYTRDANAALLGAIIGLVISVFCVLIYYVVDDGIYSERDWVNRYPDVPLLGEAGSEEAGINTEHVLGNTEGMYELKASEFEFNKDTFDKMRASRGVILHIRTGADKGDVIDKIVYTLKKQDIELKGVLTEKK